MDFSNIRGFCDLNIHHNVNVKFLDRIVSYGYRIIALNWTIDESSYEPNLPTKKQKNQGQVDMVPIPFEDSKNQKDLILNYNKKLKVLKRLTVIISKPDQLKRTLKSTNLKQFDILSVLPTTQAAFQYICGVNQVDIVSFEVGLTEYKPGGKLYKQVVARGGYFELSYAQALRSSVKRQELITMSHFFYIYGKSKNIIISSGASHVLELRNPYDVANLALLFGLSEEQGKCALSSSCRRLILQIESKKLGKTAITVEHITDTKDDQDEEPHRKKMKIDRNVSSSSELTDQRPHSSATVKIEENVSRLADGILGLLST